MVHIVQAASGGYCRFLLMCAAHVLLGSLHLADHVLEFVVDVVKCDRINVEVLSPSILYAEGIIQLSFLVFKEYG